MIYGVLVLTQMEVIPGVHPVLRIIIHHQVLLFYHLPLQVYPHNSFCHHRIRRFSHVTARVTWEQRWDVRDLINLLDVVRQVNVRVLVLQDTYTWENAAYHCLLSCHHHGHLHHFHYYNLQTFQNLKYCVCMEEDNRKMSLK